MKTDEKNKRLRYPLKNIPDGTAKGFEITDENARFSIFIARNGSSVFAYENSCPHTGSPLDWVPDQFFCKNGKNLMCATHGAIFEVDTGLCIDGPCIGDSLRSLEANILEGEVVITF